MTTTAETVDFFAREVEVGFIVPCAAGTDRIVSVEPLGSGRVGLEFAERGWCVKASDEFVTVIVDPEAEG